MLNPTNAGKKELNYLKWTVWIAILIVPHMHFFLNIINSFSNFQYDSGTWVVRNLPFILSVYFDYVQILAIFQFVFQFLVLLFYVKWFLLQRTSHICNSFTHNFASINELKRNIHTLKKIFVLTSDSGSKVCVHFRRKPP